MSQATEWRQANPARAREITNRSYYKHRAKRLEVLRSKKLMKNYGITIEQHDAMVEQQHGACLICLRSFTPLSPACVDHDHRTGAIRGLLCHACNLMLGNARDCPTVLRRAAQYLEERGTQNL